MKKIFSLAILLVACIAYGCKKEANLTVLKTASFGDGYFIERLCQFGNAFKSERYLVCGNLFRGRRLSTPLRHR
jgi:hypothetical protein